jgi:GNAT superfamily N-acetyltransferase
MGTVADFLVRPLTRDDVPAVERLTDEAYHDLALRTLRAGWPTPDRRTPEHAARWQQRLQHLLRTDPGGCWVAASGAGPDLLGAAVSLRRDLTWILSSFAVRPGTQGRGVGRQLLEAALSHGRGCLRGMIASSQDPAAARRYRLAGFTLHPAMVLRGRVPRSVLPVVERVREGSLGDRDLLDSVDRRVRDSAHGVDHEVMLQGHRLVVVDRSTGSGYAYVPPAGGVSLLAATNRRTATDLLWESLAASDPEVPVSIDHVTAVNEWAVDVGLASRLELWTEGYLALRGMKPPAPYLHNGGLL